MTVNELIAELQKMDGDSRVIVSKDAEGNGFSPLSSANDGYLYEADTTWSGDIINIEDENDYEDSDWDYITTLPAVVVLWPIN